MNANGGTEVAQYITTKYIGPTTHRGGRIRATASYAKVSLTQSYNYELDVEHNHHAAAKALAVALNWKGDWVSGGGADGNVYVNVRLAGYDFVTEEKPK